MSRRTWHSSSYPRRRRLGIEQLEDRRVLAVLTVNTLADDVIAGDGFVTLREAILAANFNFATDLGDVGDPAPILDIIEFEPVLDGGTILLDPAFGSLPVIVEDLTINAGPLDLGLTVSGGNGFDLLPGTFDGFSVFVVGGPPPAVAVELIGLSITGGDTPGAGGGIFNMGDLTLTQCTVFDNAAGAFGGGINSDGVLTVLNSTIDGNMAAIAGGGVFIMAGEATIEGSTVSNNASGGDGGGLGRGAFGPGMFLTVTGSTFFGNTAIGDGGGLWIMSPGGMMTTITNSTISGNEANDDGGGVFSVTAFGDIAIIEHTTITDNMADADGDGIGMGGGTFTAGPAVHVLDHTIVAANENGIGIADDVAGAADAFFSLIGFDPFGFIFDVVGNLIGVAGPIDPMLAPLSNNGGPTLTHRLLAGSPALNTGDPAFLPPPFADQRGGPFVRVDPAALVIDKGAYELQDLGGPLALVVSTLRDESDGDYMPGDLSLREAIDLTNGNVGFPDVITFAPALAGGTIFLSEFLGEMAIAGGLTIDAGTVPGAVTIDAGDGADGLPGTGDGMRIFNIGDLIAGPSMVVDLFGLALTGGDVTGGLGSGGGAILSNEALNLVLCEVTGNATSGAFATGGGISSTGPLTLTGTTVSMNSTSGDDADGGGIYNSGSLTVIGGGIFGNTTAGDGAQGGGIANVGTLSVTASSISGNSTSGNFAYGGGLHNMGVLTVTGSTVSGNSTAGVISFGGGIASIGSASVTDTVVAVNSTTGLAVGGGIWGEGSVALTRTTVAGNSAFADGGGISISGVGTLTVNSSTVSGNVSVGGSGGGISTNTGGAILAIDSSTISGNTAAMYGGGIFVNVPGGSTSTITRSTITGNSTGIAVSLTPGETLALNHTIVAGNGVDVERVSPPFPLGSITANYSLIGVAGTPIVNVGGSSLIGTAAAPMDPLLGPLAPNGGPTWTHMPLAGSPAINAGDPAATAGAGGVPAFDQRGAAFTRVVGGATDIGAVEAEWVGSPPALPGDYNMDGTVNSADYVWWRKTFGASVASYSGADGDGDAVINDDDHDVWQENFGESLPAPSPSSAVVESSTGALATSPVAALARRLAHAARPPADPVVRKLNARPRLVLETQTSLARRDDSLAAWFAASEHRAEAPADHDVLWHDDERTNEPSTWSVNDLDVAFESLAVVAEL